MPYKETKKTSKTSKPSVNINNYGKAVLVFSILIFILITIFLGVSLWQNGTIRNAVQLFKYSKSYQVIFLTNGQAYFGNITEITDEYVIMENPFSIKVQQKQADDESQTQSEIKLLSIEDEFYKPENYMLFEKSGILHIEELNDSSQIIEIIKSY